jgi:hypothetical protein
MWEKLYDQYIQTFGLSELYKKIINQMKKKALLELDYLITGDRFKLTLIEMESRKLEAMQLNLNSGGISIDQAIVHLSKWLGYWIRSKEICVIEFFNLLKEYERINKLSKN